ncbi:tRNA uridine-5-carboxymethylaminomethyl(34) synthesis GTPase MnmE [Rhizobiales bacterium RZME27]|jgi:tRNA modification GTPase|uniref:tRNA modification GTPase MnmE n=1 Tax=Endobacterium cereale TaxID=2663029 RepID=A0A6A8A4R7_9HYPH|nr:tRNA uridine-5-carboxymethylaminomethyl(34) synthesis GTPase MnmE [Endobacterium cereale]MEB2845232.1 tRNA uridine-5-carboxymethylaminomethyl(34) synthesis GTPase MnmE [Endobacterium cereale]MQY46013.1 tRNA uridine-5-carboxymethylaminomethyl(34) synthesis GTPase MnmE [Endobacterium cereale]
MRADDTIFALSSGSLPAGLAVFRISGSKAILVAENLAGPLPLPRHAYLRTIRKTDGSVIDRGLVITFPAPNSFTGEDSVELHLHGSQAVVSALYAELNAADMRLAEAGEFSKRALENGKLDLVEAEGLSDLLRAETEMQRRLALEQSDGGLSAIYEGWALELTRARALIEAELDFADEDDVPGSVSEAVWINVRRLKLEIDAQLVATHSAEIIRDGYQVAIVGAPNVGKSSLLNALAKRDVAIVTEIAGTTRDILHVDLDLGGFLVRFFDTAGIRETSDIVEKEGIRRAQLVLERADLILLLSDDEEPTDAFTLPEAVPVWRVGTKSDIKPQAVVRDIAISTKTGEGLDELKSLIAASVAKRWDAISFLKPGRIRHAQLLHSASNFIEEALEGSQLDMRAECLRLAAEELGRITGKVDVEHLLDIIFSEFCIGK